ncbi:MAG: hypothetical protein ACK58L_16475 [Planctomycetota bacterium]
MACIVLATRLIVFRRWITGFTIESSWKWAFPAIPALIASSVVCSPTIRLEAGWRTLLQYLAAVVMLAPPICTLGARKPGLGAWHWFVVLPMVLVLCWPAMSQVISSRGLESLHLGGPALIAIGLVMVMGLGTGLGTEMILPASLCGAAIFCCLAPSAGWSFLPPSSPLAAPWILLLSERVATKHLQTIHARLTSAATMSEAMDAIWHLFQYCYGLPWTRRVQDRVNQFAAREQWTVQLTLDGFRTAAGQSASDAQLEMPCSSFCWVLQRFVSDEWIGRALSRFRRDAETGTRDEADSR